MNETLTSDCEHCFGLCCVALPYAKSADFPFHKDGGEPCRNLLSDNRCKVHHELRDKGFHGCVSYECFGAGQHVSQKMYGGRDWRGHTELRKEMFAVFPLIQQLYEMLWYLTQALSLNETKPIHAELKQLYERTVELTLNAPNEIIQLGIDMHRSKVNKLLIETSELYRRNQANKHEKKSKRSFDYMGADLRGRNFHGSNFRGVLLIAANLSYADLRKVDFIGADLRDANLEFADLSDALFLTQAQVNSAKGNIATKIPDFLVRPHHWLAQSDK
ncbi:hypothetical protein CHH80_12040 [Bacillus sp. 7504-2]|nr:hypothetical protein CHH80_12040 [Bacillus sp. 7504-2]